MTNDEVRRAQQRIADQRAARRAEIDAAAPTPARGSGVGTAPFVVGDRVLDLRSGSEGEVSHVGEPDRTGDFVVGVRLDTGRTGIRQPGDLLPRPRPPAGRP